MSTNAWYKTRLYAGQCVRCGGTREQTERTRCNSCLEKNAQRQNEVRKTRHLFYSNKNVCIECLKEHVGPTKTCKNCMGARYKRFRVLNEKRRASGLCRCGNPATAKLYCLNCWFKNMAAAHLGSKQHADELRRLWIKQEGLCAYTGVKLIPGVNASIDHIIPKKQNGPRNINNLQWVAYDVNMAKRALPHVTFIKMCKAVAARFPFTEE